MFKPFHEESKHYDRLKINKLINEWIAQTWESWKEGNVIYPGNEIRLRHLKVQGSFSNVILFNSKFGFLAPIREAVFTSLTKLYEIINNLKNLQRNSETSVPYIS